MRHHIGPSHSTQLAKELERLWSQPKTAECQRLSREAEKNQQAAQLDAWEGEGGTSAPGGMRASG